MLLGRVRFGIIGCGSIGQVHGDIIKELPNAELVAISNRTEETCVQISDRFDCEYYTDYKEILEDPNIDAVAICLPSGDHSEAVIEAAKHKKHIICEKPIDTVVDRAKSMIDACRDNDVKFSVIFQHRFDPTVKLLKSAIDRGLLGKLLWGSSKTIWYRDDKYYNNPWRGTWEYDGGGALINQSIHYIDLLIHIFGDVKSVNGNCKTLLHKKIETEDLGVATVEFENGCIGTIEGSTVSYPGLYAELAVFGEKGSVIIRNDELFFYHFESGKDKEFEDMLNVEKAMRLNTGPEVDISSHIKQYEDFVEAIIEDRDPLVTGEEGIKSLELIKSIYKSSEKESKVYL